MIPKEKIEAIKKGIKLVDLVPDLQPSGKNFTRQCPSCGKSGKGKGLVVTPAKNIAKCFSCDFFVGDAIDYLMKVDGMDFVPAVEHLAARFGYDIKEDAPPDRASPKRKHQLVARASFCETQLAGSGLTSEDVEVLVRDGAKETRHPAFVRGTRDQYGRVLEGAGDDMLIFYHDLAGNPVKYKDKSGKFLDLVRVRWSNPELHKDKEGRPIKYQSPAGSGSHLYIPERVRELYRHKRPIQRLFIQEGEKKAEKCCKHGIISVGIMGIQNLGYNNQLPVELQLIIQECDVKEVVFMLDSDWNHLSENLKVADQVDRRPLSFFYAVKNYKEYMRTLVNLNISVEIYFGHVIENDKRDKGIDDLLVNTLKGSEYGLREDIDRAIHDKKGGGAWVHIYKITQMPDNKIADLWLLNDAEQFAERHRHRLAHLKEFRIGKLLRRFGDDGTLVLAQPLLEGEEFWEVLSSMTRDGNEKNTLSFNYYKAWQFLQHRGYFQVRMKSGIEEFVHVDGKIITKVRYIDIRNYVTSFVKEIKRIDVLNMLYRGGPQYLGPEKLSHLETISPVIERSTKLSQRLYFKDKFWDISPEGIEEKPYTQLAQHVWGDKIIDFSPKLLPEFVDVEILREEHIQKLNLKIAPDKEFSLEYSNDAENCAFFKFLYNASNFVWRKSAEETTNEEKIEWCRHLMNKLTSIGYLLHDYKNESELKAVVIMDGKISEVGASNGRSGKSLMMKAIEYVIPQLYIPAKNKKLTEDQFIWDGVTEKIKNIFLDDVRANVDFEFFFPLITGKLKVNPKGAPPFTLEPEDTPKLALTTNHAINGDGSSFKDRMALVSFSDFYNEKHKPIHDFGRNFFSEWDDQEWNRFYNLMANCLILYFRSLKNAWGKTNQGIIDPPMDSLEKRRLRQAMGEIFLTWADAFFTRENLNFRQPRQAMYDKFVEFDVNIRKYYNSTKFGKCIRHYCEYSGYHLNPQKANEENVMFLDFVKEYPDRSFFGSMDKSGGIEYFTIADKHWTGR
ncbi:MAG: DNA primase [Odoribacteraceae bacterium]|jgi:hypothetical protein|nr:DNA primase [Odoribacteraceae bacterium]